MVQPTSLEAYGAIIPELGERQQVVLDAIQKYPDVSNHDLSRILQLEINCVTPRVKELREYGMVLENGLKVDRITGRRCMKWIAAE